MSTLHITTGSGKLSGILSINTPTSTNPFCKSMQKTDSICRSCYAQKYENFRKGMVQAFERNLHLTERPLLVKDIPIIDAQVMRLHSYGELHNTLHFNNLCDIAYFTPRTLFTLWTKRKDIVQKVLRTRDKPANLILIYSSPVVGKKARLPKGFDKVFTVHEKGTEQEINCHGACNTCRLCYSHNDIKNINEIIK